MQLNSADEGDYRQVVEYGNKVIAHLAAIRGRPVEPLKRQKALGDHDARLVADSVASSEGQRITYVFHRAPPCQRSLDDLRNVYISELRWSEVHRGSVLVLRTLSMARDLRMRGDDAFMAIVEDQLGSVHRLRIYNLLPSSQTMHRRDLEDSLPPGTVLAIKEPYCEAATEETSGIRIDHPSDLFYLPEGHPLFPVNWRHEFDDPGVSPSESLKDKGNAFFKKQKYRLAVQQYTVALRFEHSPTLGASLLLNRSQAYILMGEYSLAAADVQKYLSEIATNPDHNESQDEKALFRGAKALYASRKYNEALEYLERLVKAFPKNREARFDLSNTKQRIEEMNSARFDWSTLIKEARTSVPSVDIADFVGPIEQSGGTGSWSAKRDIKAGELLLANKALEVLFAAEVENGEKMLVYDATRSVIGESEGWKLTQKIAAKVARDPQLVGEVHRLASGLGVYREDERSAEDGPEDITIADGRAIVDINVVDAVRDAFATPFPAIHPLITGPASILSGVGMWTSSARPHLPHSCIPNAARSFLGDVLILRACQNIPRGEIISISHVHPALPLEERKAELTRPGTSLQACACQFCEVEKDEGNEMRARRVELVQRVKALSDKAPSETLRTDSGRNEDATPAQKDVKAIAKEVSKVCSELESTFTQPHLPHFAILEPLSYLFACYLFLGAKYTDDALRTNSRYFAALGFEFDYLSNPAGGSGGADAGGDIVILRHGYYHPLLVKTLVQQSSVCWQLGKRRTAESWRRIAENAMEIVAGHRLLFKEGFGNVYASLGWTI